MLRGRQKKAYKLFQSLPSAISAGLYGVSPPDGSEEDSDGFSLVDLLNDISKVVSKVFLVSDVGAIKTTEAMVKDSILCDRLSEIAKLIIHKNNDEALKLLHQLQDEILEPTTKSNAVLG